MTRHTVILHTGYFFSFDHAKEMDWEHARAIIGCKLIEMTKARWDGNDYNMLIDEEGSLLKDKKINQKATSAYQTYWFKNFQGKLKEINTKIYGNAIIIEE